MACGCPSACNPSGSNSYLPVKTEAIAKCRQPSIVDVQILRVGQLVILAVPGELTTMSGRRLRQAIYDQVPLFVHFMLFLMEVLPFAFALLQLHPQYEAVIAVLQ